MATIDLKLKSYDELQFEITTLITDNYLKQQQIDQLTNNWNELEKWLYENESFDDYCNETTFTAILDKMKEIKEKNDSLQ